MLRKLITKSKYIAFTLRFSILSIFVTFFIVAMATLIAFTYYKSSEAMTALSFHLMNESSNSAFERIVNEMQHIEYKCKSSARQLELNVIDGNDINKLYQYTTDLIEYESAIFPSLQSVFWGDQRGNFVMTEKLSDGNISSYIIDHSKNTTIQTHILRDKQGNIISTSHADDFNLDPRNHTWYQAAIKTGRLTWSNVYLHKMNDTMGISVSTPVYDSQKKIIGVISYNIRLNYLRHLIENIDLTENSVLFIATKSGELLAYPYLEQYQNKSLINMQALPRAPWVTASFNQYMASGKSAFMFNYNNNNYLATYKIISIFGPSDWLVGAVVPMDDFTGSLRNMQIITVIFSLCVLILGIAFVSALITAVVNPLQKIIREIHRIKHFELHDSPLIRSRIKEISYIEEALHSMKKGLRSFQKYVPATFVRQLIESGEDARAGGVKKQIAILFTDIHNFTTITEQTSPEVLTKHICDYFDELTNIILNYHGTIDKYIGDAIMAFWGAPASEDHTAQHAALASILCVKRLRELNAKWALEGKPVLATRFGIHLGEAIVGNLGSSERLNYTAIGDSINIANRLEGINKLYGTQIIISETVYHAIKDFYVTRMLDCVRLKGKVEPYYIYELITDELKEVTYDINSYNQTFRKAFAAYQIKRWDEAIYYFNLCTQIYPEDEVSQLFIKRCEKCRVNMPSEEWDGIWVYNE